MCRISDGECLFASEIMIFNLTTAKFVKSLPGLQHRHLSRTLWLLQSANIDEIPAAKRQRVCQEFVDTEPTQDTSSSTTSQSQPDQTALKTDGMEETLICSICQDILYHCIR